MEQKASYPALSVLLLPLVSVMSCHLMGAQNSPARPHRFFSKTAEHDTAYLHWPILTAEVGVKTIKRLITDKTSARGDLDTDAFQRAMLQYTNTLDKETKPSPTQCLFGCTIRDFIFIHPGRYEPHPTRMEILLAREEALRNRHMKMAERLTEHSRHLPQNGIIQEWLLKSASLTNTSFG